jgi:CubicO group peptidase (beta-lactamase class C family)
VSAAVEAAADERFLSFLRRQVFEPLGMDDTTDDSTTESILDRATAYFPRFGADPKYGLHLMREIDYSCYAGASVFLSTPSDLVRFGTAMNSGSCCNPPRSNCSRRHSDWPRGRRRVTALAGTSRPSRWRVSKRTSLATTATRWAGSSRR